MVRRLLSLTALCILSATAFAQVGAGSLKGTITDAKSGEPLPFVNVLVENKGTQVAGGATDFDGVYLIKPIEPGTYDVSFNYVGYQPVKQTGVVINGNKITFLDIKMESGLELKEFKVVKYQVPLIERDGGASGGTVTRDQISKMPGRTANSIASTVAGASTAGTGGGISIRGSRTENTYYYIDGVKVPAGAGTGLPKSAIEEVQVITGGVPANYGDVTGGVISITTRGPSRTFFGGLEYLTSGWKVGEDITDIVGLDAYAFNQLEGSISGPVFFKKDSVGNKTKPLLGFFLSGQYTNVVDEGPQYIHDPRVKKEVRDRLLAEPLTVRDVAGQPTAFYNANDLTSADMEELRTRQNAGRTSYLATAKVDITTTPTVNLTVGGSFEYSKQQDYSRNNSLLNAENNNRSRDLTWRGFVRFTQRFNQRQEDDVEGSTAKKGGIKNAFYSVQIDYSRFDSRDEDPVHGDRLFDYGHIGKFETYRRNNYTFNAEQEAFVQDGWRDTLVTFEASDLNPDVAAVTSQYFNLFEQEPSNIFDPTQEDGPYTNFDAIQSGQGILNGGGPDRVYALYNNIGSLANTYRKRQTDQLRLSATGSADIGQHAVSVGIEYEQVTSRDYNLAPVGLWGLARGLANNHIREIDESISTYNYIFGQYPFIDHPRLIGDDQSYFDSQLRDVLGLDVNGSDFINLDAIDPSLLSIDMFSADELINSGENIFTASGGLVNSYHGYDHTGNKIVGRPSLDDFFNDVDANGNHTRLQAPFQPIYIAGYIMDKFAFDDIIFNVGVRVDRYDANQSVLKDPYLQQLAYTAGSSVPLGDGQISQQLANRPGNIGDDFVVYVNDFTNPSAVVGYRDGDDWYNALGERVTDPSVLRSASGIQPYLINKGNDGQLAGSKLNQNAFKDYDPVVNFMPRVAFSFPISDEAVFFAHYDVLTQRPTNASRLDLLNYAYVQTTGNTINNPNLRPTKTIDYELGFQQVLTKSSSLKISAFYRELRDMIQVRNMTEAWPVSYKTFDNIDFGTVKGFTLTYDLRRTGNVWMRASYTLQFADGTGSDVNTSLALVNSGQPNLRTIAPLNFDQRHKFQVTTDFRYGSGKDYNGPMLFGKPILQSTGVNVVTLLGSGTPYSPSSRIINEGEGVGSHSLNGSINGSRLPWQFTMDLQLDRDIPLSFGKGEDKAKSANLNIYLLVTNVLNTRNVTGVWRGTGAPDDDGYLAAAQYQNEINGKDNPDAYRDLYALKVDDPGNYGAPRTARLGIRFDF
ncbi:MAG: TonB-dependent receptor [Flavobacteriales bacterium]|nr:TonB-dependent receptor [Flavobacteriales bacterium]